jgi:chemotaxis protein methyltransferase CheR
MSNAALSFDDEASALLEQLCIVLSTRTGLVLTRAHWGDLRRVIALVARDLDHTDWVSCLRWLLSTEGGAHYQQLIDHITVGETYFFRDGAMFEFLRERILPDVISARRERGKFLRIWSAGCCSGEEPYSIAIELLRALPDWRDWKITLLATDINQRFLQKARRGIYERWSLRHKTLPPCAPYLIPLPKGRFEVAPVVRELVTFQNLNFASHLYPSALTNTHDMDIIFCRNALMYLQPECIQDVVARLSASLVDGGWLITSTIEAALVRRPELHAVRLPDLVIFRKDMTDTAALVRRNEYVVADNNSVAKKAQIKSQPPPRVATVAKQKSQTSAASELLSAHESTALTGLMAVRALADRGDLDAARAECEKIMTADKLNAEANFLYASILLELGSLPAAEKALLRTLYLDEKHIVAHVALASLLQQTDRRVEAQRHWRSAQKLLRQLAEDDIVQASEGLTAKQMYDMVGATLMTC